MAWDQTALLVTTLNTAFGKKISESQFRRMYENVHPFMGGESEFDSIGCWADAVRLYPEVATAGQRKDAQE